MNIENNKEIQEFIKYCKKNIVNFSTNLKNDCIKLNNDNKKYFLEIIKRFNSEDNNLFYDKKMVIENPFFKNIKIDNINTSTIKFQNNIIPKNHAINISWVVPDEKRLLNDYIVFKACKENIKVPVLTENNEVWMSPSLAEQNTINPFAAKAQGNVLTFGLGLGYFPYMCTLNKNVKSITIVEKSKTVIDMFKEYILPQFKSHIDINIVEGDLFDFYNELFLNQFDYIFVDVWKDNEHGLEVLEKLFETNGVYKGNIDYWIEFSCMQYIRFLMLLYFDNIISKTYTQQLSIFLKENMEFARKFKKIHKYFRNIDKTVTRTTELQDFLYDSNVIRDILAIHI